MYSSYRHSYDERHPLMSLQLDKKKSPVDSLKADAAAGLRVGLFFYLAGFWYWWTGNQSKLGLSVGLATSCVGIFWPTIDSRLTSSRFFLVSNLLATSAILWSTYTRRLEDPNGLNLATGVISLWALLG